MGRLSHFVAVLVTALTLMGCGNTYHEPPPDPTQNIYYKLQFPLAPNTQVPPAFSRPAPGSPDGAAEQMTDTTHLVQRIWGEHFAEKLRLLHPYAQVNALRNVDPAEQKPVFGESLCPLDYKGDPYEFTPHSDLANSYCAADNGGQGTIWYAINKRCCTSLFRAKTDHLRGFQQVVVAGFAVGQDLTHALYKQAGVKIPPYPKNEQVAACYTGVLLQVFYPPTGKLRVPSYVQDTEHKMFDVSRYREEVVVGYNAGHMSACLQTYAGIA